MFGCVMYAMLAPDLFMLHRACVCVSWSAGRCRCRPAPQPVINHVGAERTIYVRKRAEWTYFPLAGRLFRIGGRERF